MTNPTSHGVSRVVHHKDFYLRGGDMTVMVENHSFRIHSHFFTQESLFFREKLNANRDSDIEDHGSGVGTYTYTMTLDDVKSEDFARFLWVFYNPKYSVYEAPVDTWLSILILANKWGFNNVKELAIRELEKIDIEPVEKIVIYHHHISRLYLIPSYVALCTRDEPLTRIEGDKLGMDIVVRIAEARERIWKQAWKSGVETPTFDDSAAVIREVFCLGPSPSPTSPTPGTVPNVPTNPAPSNPSMAKRCFCATS